VDWTSLVDVPTVVYSESREVDESLEPQNRNDGDHATRKEDANQTQSG
jgi:hypothetical protein